MIPLIPAKKRSGMCRNQKTIISFVSAERFDPAPLIPDLQVLRLCVQRKRGGWEWGGENITLPV